MSIDSLVLPQHVFNKRLETWAAHATRYPFFEGSVADLLSWFHDIEAGALDVGIPKEQRTESAIYFLPADLRATMEERQREYRCLNSEPFWDWEDFKLHMTRVVGEAAETSKVAPEDRAGIMMELRDKHPYILASASWGLVIGGSAAAVPSLGLAALNTAGFAAGVAAVSLASLYHSASYNGLTAGITSSLQSIAATSIASSVSSLFTAGSAVFAGLSSLTSRATLPAIAGTSSSPSAQPPPQMVLPLDRKASLC